MQEFGPEVSPGAIAATAEVTATILGLLVAAYLFLLGNLQSQTAGLPAAIDLRRAQISLHYQQLVLLVVLGLTAVLASVLGSLVISAGVKLPLAAPGIIGLDMLFIPLSLVLVLLSLSPNERRRIGEAMLDVAENKTDREPSEDFVRAFRELEFIFHKHGFDWNEWRDDSYDPAIEPGIHDAAQILTQEGVMADTYRARWVRDLLETSNSRWVHTNHVDALENALSYWRQFDEDIGDSTRDG